MQRIDTATRVPDLFGAGKAGFTAGDPLTGTPATSMSASQWNALQEEICGLIESWLGALDAGSYVQLKNAIEAKITALIAAANVTGKVSKSGDTMTGALLIAMNALQLTLRNSDNTAAVKEHLKLFRGSGVGSRAALQSFGDAANGLSEVHMSFLNSSDVLVNAFKFKSTGRFEIGADPVLALDVATKQYVDIRTVPTGSSIYWNGTSAPTGFMIENGAAVSRVTYAALFGATGTTFGVGDGVNTFNLPESRGEFVRGLDSGRGIDSGRTLAAAQADMLKSHNHDPIRTGGGNGLVNVYTDALGTTTNSPAFRTTGHLTDFGGAETRPRNVAKLICIKY